MAKRYQLIALYPDGTLANSCGVAKCDVAERKAFFVAKGWTVTVKPLR